MAIEKKQNDLATFHTSQFDECLSWWLDPSEGDAAGISSEYAAYHLLAHAAFLSRTCHLEGKLRQLESMTRDHLAVLVKSAMTFAIGFKLPLEAEGILGKEAAEPEDIEFFEHLLCHRDELDLVIELAKRFAREIQEGELRHLIATAVSVASGIDELLLSRADLTSVCSRVLVDVRPLNWMSDGSYPDWFKEARRWDDEYELPLIELESTSDDVGQPRFAIMLAEASNEIDAREASRAIAASAAKVLGVKAAALQSKRFSVASEPNVKVRFELRQEINDQRIVVVRLVGGTSKAKYLSAELGVQGGVKRQINLQRGRGTVTIQKDEALTVDSMFLLDAEGNRLAVK